MKYRAKRPQGHKLDGTFKKSKRGKYNQQGRHEDGHWFASKAEAERYLQLKQLRDQGKIEHLELQPSFPVQVKGIAICTYRADFRYIIISDGGWRQDVVEDVKGLPTPEYKLKKKLVEAIYQIPIHEISPNQLKHGALTALELKNLNT
jgi:hypothetical protein